MYADEAKLKPVKAWRTTAGTIEGWMSLVVAAIVWTTPYPGHWEGPAVVVVVLHALGIGLAIGGIRFGRTGAKTVATLALAMLLAMLGWHVVDGLNHWQEVVYYWTGKCPHPVPR